MNIWLNVVEKLGDEGLFASKTINNLPVLKVKNGGCIRRPQV